MERLIYYELKLLAPSKLSYSKNILYGMLYLLGKKFSKIGLTEVIKQDISETIIQAYPLGLLKKTQCHNPISSCPVIENGPVFS